MKLPPHSVTAQEFSEVIGRKKCPEILITLYDVQNENFSLAYMEVYSGLVRDGAELSWATFQKQMSFLVEKGFLKRIKNGHSKISLTTKGRTFVRMYLIWYKEIRKVNGSLRDQHAMKQDA